MRSCLSAGLAAALVAAAPLRAENLLLPMSPTGQVWTKSVPTFQAAWTESKRDPFGLLDVMDLRLKRFVARHNIEQVKPLIIEFPDLGWTPEQHKGKVLFMVPLPPDSGILPPEGEEILVDLREECPVVSVSFKGPYTWENVAPHMKELAAWIKEQKKIIEGRPRLLIYHHLAFRPDWMRCAELQVPIR
jgi:hypothetical protein